MVECTKFVSIILVMVNYWPVVSHSYYFESGPVSKDGIYPCPGLYCGRHEINSSYLSGCGRCNHGWRVANNSHSICILCQDTPEVYDWFYLLFVMLSVLALHWFAIDVTVEGFFSSLCLSISALVEVSSAAIFTLLVYPPVGELSLQSCRVQRLSDWYTLLYNPQPNYESTLHCAQEAVYPLYTMSFTFYAFCLLTMACLRIPLAWQVLRNGQSGRLAAYAALYFLPILAAIHAVLGGLIYVSFPYIVVIFSVISSAFHFAMRIDQDLWNLLLQSIYHLRNVLVIFGHWLVHAFGILALIELSQSSLHYSILLLIPLPAIFYIATAKFTNPSNIDA